MSNSKTVRVAIQAANSGTFTSGAPTAIAAETAAVQQSKPSDKRYRYGKYKSFRKSVPQSLPSVSKNLVGRSSPTGLSSSLAERVDGAAINDTKKKEVE